MPKKQSAALVRRPKSSVARYKNHAYLNPDGSVHGEKLLKIVRETPGALMLIVAAGVIKGLPEPEYNLHDMVDGIANLIMLAGHGDEHSIQQLKAIEKLIRPAKYELPFHRIKEIVDKYETSPPRARGWELRAVMSNLAHVVEPLRKDKPYTPDQPVKMSETQPAVFVGMADLARRHMKTNSTLQSLAIDIYLEHLADKGITDEGQRITVRTLKKDLAAVKLWEKTASEEEKLRRGKWTGAGVPGGEFITWYEFSKGWMKKKKARASKKIALTRGTHRQ